MSSMLSVILVILFTFTPGGSSVVPDVPVVPGKSAGSLTIYEKARLGVKKNFPAKSVKKIRVNPHPIKEKKIPKGKRRRDPYLGYNKIHMKMYEQRMHDSGKGDVFGYDEIRRLTGVKFNVPDPALPNPTDFEREKAIQFDKTDNITSILETTGSTTNTITTDIPGDSNYAKLNQYAYFDQWGLEYDLNGNTTQKGTQHFTYDYRNQIVSATDGADGSTTVDFKYDALGRRIQKTISTGSQNQTRDFYYSGNRVIEERDGDDQVTQQLIYGNGIDELVRLDAYNGSTITPYYVHRDGTGSTTALTDANGSVVERYKYGLYGKTTFMDASGNVISNSAIGNHILFQGREFDKELNLYYYRARYLDPIMGRFLQTDPKGYTDSMNLYQAFNQNSVNFTDPFGDRLIFDKRYFNDNRKYEKFKGQVLEMIKYLFFGSKTARKYLIALIEDQNFDINLLYKKNEMIFLPNEKVFRDITKKDAIIDNEKQEWHGLFIDPLSGLRLEKKIYDEISGSLRERIPLDYVQSPAIGFIHELIHAYIHKMNPKEEDFLLSLLIKGYVNQLEKKVINEETNIASELGEPARFNHGGDEYRVESPTSYSLSLENNLWFTDSRKKDYDQDLVRLFERIIKLIAEIGEVKKY